MNTCRWQGSLTIRLLLPTQSPRPTERDPPVPKATKCNPSSDCFVRWGETLRARLAPRTMDIVLPRGEFGRVARNIEGIRTHAARKHLQSVLFRAHPTPPCPASLRVVCGEEGASQQGEAPILELHFDAPQSTARLSNPPGSQARGRQAKKEPCKQVARARKGGKWSDMQKGARAGQRIGGKVGRQADEQMMGGRAQRLTTPRKWSGRQASRQTGRLASLGRQRVRQADRQAPIP